MADVFVWEITRCAKDPGQLLFLICRFRCWLAGQANSGDVEVAPHLLALFYDRIFYSFQENQRTWRKTKVSLFITWFIVTRSLAYLFIYSFIHSNYLLTQKSLSHSVYTLTHSLTHSTIYSLSHLRRTLTHLFNQLFTRSLCTLSLDFTLSH